MITGAKPQKETEQPQPVEIIEERTIHDKILHDDDDEDDEEEENEDEFDENGEKKNNIAKPLPFKKALGDTVVELKDIFKRSVDSKILF